MRTIAPLLLALTLAFGAHPAQAQRITANPERSWIVLTVTTDVGGELTLLFGTRVVDGRIAICGTGFTGKTHALHQQLIPGIVADLRFTLGRTQLLQDVDDFRFHTSRDEMLRNPAGCTLTRVAADPALLRQPLTATQRRGQTTLW